VCQFSSGIPNYRRAVEFSCSRGWRRKQVCSGPGQKSDAEGACGLRLFSAYPNREPLHGWPGSGRSPIAPAYARPDRGRRRRARGSKRAGVAISPSACRASSADAGTSCESASPSTGIAGIGEIRPNAFAALGAQLPALVVHGRDQRTDRLADAHFTIEAAACSRTCQCTSCSPPAAPTRPTAGPGKDQRRHHGAPDEVRIVGEPAMSAGRRPRP